MRSEMASAGIRLVPRWTRHPSKRTSATADSFGIGHPPPFARLQRGVSPHLQATGNSKPKKKAIFFVLFHVVVVVVVVAAHWAGLNRRRLDRITRAVLPVGPSRDVGDVPIVDHRRPTALVPAIQFHAIPRSSRSHRARYRITSRSDLWADFFFPTPVQLFHQDITCHWRSLQNQSDSFIKTSLAPGASSFELRHLRTAFDWPRMADQSEAANFKLSPISWPSLNASIMKLHSRQSTSAFVGLDWFLFVFCFFLFSEFHSTTKNRRSAAEPQIPSLVFPTLVAVFERMRVDIEDQYWLAFCRSAREILKTKQFLGPLCRLPVSFSTRTRRTKKKTHTNTLNAGHTHTHTHPPTPTVSSSLSWLTDPPPRKKKKE